MLLKSRDLFMYDLDRQNPVLSRYLSSAYAEQNPSWDREHSSWKARWVLHVLRANDIQPQRVAEIGCGAGAVLAELNKALPGTTLHGFDIAPAAARFWSEYAGTGIEFTLGDFLMADDESYDVVLLLDVLEHLANPFEFLMRVRCRANHFVFHIPLDLSAMNVLRESPLLHVREKVGHLHYFTRRLALSLLRECGYEVVSEQYTGAAFRAPQRGWRTKLAALPRRLVSLLNRDFSALLLGGETLIVCARPAGRR